MIRWVAANRLELSGEIDMANAGEFRAAIDTAIAQRPGELIVDIGQLEFCDSTCIACILRALQAGLPVRLVDVAEHVGRALEISGITGHELLTIE